jgi:Flp pilus assembly protein TadG
MFTKLLQKLHRTDGQILVWFALSLGIFLLFAALAVDMGMIYFTKAKLCNAVDGAVLTAAKNYSSLGETTSQTIGADVFQANFGSSAPTLTWTWCTGTPACNGVISAQLHASTSYHTAFMQYLPQWTYWTIGDTATAQRSTLVMDIVLDRSGSMGNDGGMTALKSAVPQFVGSFSNGTDYIGMISFASHSSIDVAITQQFLTPIDNAVSALSANGGTFGTAAGSGTVYSSTNGPPMSMADSQLGSVTLPSGAPEVKVMVYFTDGLMNTLQDQFMCPTTTLMNYGGADPNGPDEGGGSLAPPTYVVSLDPGSENWQYCMDVSGGCNSSTYLPQYLNGQMCTYNGQQGMFPSQQFGTLQQITRANVTAEADWRAKYTASQMRKESIPTYIYTIGLGTAVSNDVCTKALLATIANDPIAPTYKGNNCPQGQYDSTQTQGQFYIVPNCPGTQCTEELNLAFQSIYTKVALRLTQ